MQLELHVLIIYSLQTLKAMFLLWKLEADEMRFLSFDKYSSPENLDFCY